MIGKPNIPRPDASERWAVLPTTVYTVDRLPALDVQFYTAVRKGMRDANALRVPPHDARAFEVKAGQIFRITSVEGSQVGDLNLWNAHDLSERFSSGKTRALHATHVSTGDCLWSTLPSMRPLLLPLPTTPWIGTGGMRTEGGFTTSLVHALIPTRIRC